MTQLSPIDWIVCLAYYYAGEADSRLRKIVTNLIVGNSLLTAAGFPMCGESDLKTCVAMLIMDHLGIGGSFAEFHPVDFSEDFVLVGHDCTDRRYPGPALRARNTLR